MVPEQQPGAPRPEPKPAGRAPIPLPAGPDEGPHASGPDHRRTTLAALALFAAGLAAAAAFKGTFSRAPQASANPPPTPIAALQPPAAPPVLVNVMPAVHNEIPTPASIPLPFLADENPGRDDAADAADASRLDPQAGLDELVPYEPQKPQLHADAAAAPSGPCPGCASAVAPKAEMAPSATPADKDLTSRYIGPCEGGYLYQIANLSDRTFHRLENKYGEIYVIDLPPGAVRYLKTAHAPSRR
ncbi:MAG: hypothetical protein NTY77_11330 [Elusimicrobia bacterium]|nr:hypothetical protein [Elusimicrobiota bacterium]